MRLFLLPALLLGICGVAAAQQNPTWVEARFHRVYLKNGNFIDGQLVEQSAREIVLKLGEGEINIRTDQIDRLEVVKMRSINEKLIQVPVAKSSQVPAASSVRPGVPAPPAPPPPSSAEDAVPVFPASDETRKKVDPLLTELAHANPEAKLALLDRLAGVGDDAGPYLASLLGKVDGEDVSVVTAAIVRGKDKRAIPILGRQTQSKNPLLRAAAASALGGLADESISGYLVPLLKDGDTNVRGIAVTSLAEMKDRGSLQAIMGVFADPDRGVRTKSIQLSSELAAKLEMKAEYHEELVKALDQGDARVRFDLIGALGRSKARDRWSPVSLYLRDDLPELRSIAATSLGLMGATEAGDAIASQTAQESDARVKLALAGASRLLHAKGSIPSLILWLNDGNEMVKAEALSALEALTGERFGYDALKWDAWWTANRPK